MLKMKALRLVSNMTQAEVGKAIGVSRQTVAAWEDGRVYPLIKNCKALAALYQCDMAELFREDAEIK